MMTEAARSRSVSPLSRPESAESCIDAPGTHPSPFLPYSVLVLSSSNTPSRQAKCFFLRCSGCTGPVCTVERAFCMDRGRPVSSLVLVKHAFVFLCSSQVVDDRDVGYSSLRVHSLCAGRGPSD